MNRWNVFSNHGHVLLFLARHPDARLRDVAANVGITERAVQKIVRDMQDSGVVEVTRIGRRNHYTIDGQAPLQHALEEHRRVGQLIDLIAGPEAGSSLPAREAPAVPPAEPEPVPEPEAAAKPSSATQDSGSTADEAEPARQDSGDPPDAGEQRPLF